MSIVSYHYSYCYQTPVGYYHQISHFVIQNSDYITRCNMNDIMLIEFLKFSVVMYLYKEYRFKIIKNYNRILIYLKV